MEVQLYGQQEVIVELQILGWTLLLGPKKGIK
jgi:hypothetical protein